MKKKLFAALAATLAGATLALSGCSSGNDKITFGNYWNYNTEPTSTEEIVEHFEYDVAFESRSRDFINYDLAYNEGTYTIDMVSNGNKTYTVKTEFSIKVTFTVNGNTETKTDSVEAGATFHEAGGTNNLRPISSYKTITSHSPVATNSAGVAKDCYQRFDYDIKTTYEDGNGKCTSIRKYYDAEKDTIVDELSTLQEFSFSATSSKHTVLDNEQFPIAFRAIPAGTSATVQMFNPFLGYSQGYAVSLSGDVKEKEYTYQHFGEEITKNIKYRTATIAVDGTASGQPQWAEIASLVDAKTNTNRNIMLAYYAPLAYDMGVLQYKLKVADFGTDSSL